MAFVFRKHMTTIGVIGGATASEHDAACAYEVGRLIALKNVVLICGGLGGVMESAACGAAEHGGIVVGIIPGGDKGDAN
ncbi:MAG: hypothetical protein JW795_04565, partial [Chitinivibrionales bacterium]|nr:hypothetical protein [Chitinivibrionales bacterium]